MGRAGLRAWTRNKAPSFVIHAMNGTGEVQQFVSKIARWNEPGAAFEPCARVAYQSC